MSDIFVERQRQEPLTEAGFWSLAAEANGCLDLHRVSWASSLVSADGHDLVCHFTAADAESVRIALREAGSVPDRIWAGTLHDAPGLSPERLAGGNVVVTREFDAPVTIEDIQAIEDAGKDCLDMHRVRFLRSFFSNDRTRMICLYNAPDAESVRMAQREAKMPVDRVFAVRRFTPESL